MEQETQITSIITARKKSGSKRRMREGELPLQVFLNGNAGKL